MIISSISIEFEIFTFLPIMQCEPIVARLIEVRSSILVSLPTSESEPTFK